jgi:hypothetical protein
MLRKVGSDPTRSLVAGHFQGQDAMNTQPNRSAIVYLGMLGFATWFALLSRQYALTHPSSSLDAVGDILWALVAFSAIGLFFPTMSTWQAASWAFIIPALIALSDLYHVAWLDAIRGTSIGFLVFGTELATLDFACYAASAIAGMCFELFVLE